MRERPTVKVPVEIEEVQLQFENWRRERKRGQRIPENLWAIAVELGKQHGVWPTARTLHLDHNRLKRRVGNGEDDRSSGAFVELISQKLRKNERGFPSLADPRNSGTSVMRAPIPDSRIPIYRCAGVSGRTSFQPGRLFLPTLMPGMIRCPYWEKWRRYTHRILNPFIERTPENWRSKRSKAMRIWL